MKYFFLLLKILCIIIIFLISFSLPSFSQANYFTQLPSQPPEVVISLAYNQTNGYVYGVNYKSVYCSIDSGSSWTKLSDPPSININCIYCTPNGDLYIGVDSVKSFKSGLLKYEQPNDSWTTINNAPTQIQALFSDSVGNLIVSTGMFAALSPHYWQYGTGVYKFDGTNWSDISKGLKIISGYSDMPLVSCFCTDTNKFLYAGTYGTGIYKMTNGQWEQINSGLTNLNVNALARDSSGDIIAGCDSNIFVFDGKSWTKGVSSPDRPIRCLSVDADYNIYAGSGYFCYQNGKLISDIFLSSDNGANWNFYDDQPIQSDIMCIVSIPNGQTIVGAAGFYINSNGFYWNHSNKGYATAAQTIGMQIDTFGNIYVYTSNYTWQKAFPGIFLTTDKGLSWEQTNDGLNCQIINTIFIDDNTNLWVGASVWLGGNSYYNLGNAQLYKSGWIVQNIVSPSISYSGFAQYINGDPNGNIYASAGGGNPTNVYLTKDGLNWESNLNSGSANGGSGLGIAVDTKNNVYVGTATKGIMRNAGGLAVNFSSINGGPTVNCLPFVCPQNDFLFSSGTGTVSNYFFGSSDSGATVFPFSNFPGNTTPLSMCFDNKGTAYITAKGGSPGFYTAASPWNSTSNFNRIMKDEQNGIPWIFDCINQDRCGTIYVANDDGSGIWVKTEPVSTPRAPNINLPWAGSQVSLTTILNWSEYCPYESFTLQISDSSDFTNIKYSSNYISNSSLTLSQGILDTASFYYWRVAAVNAAGQSNWSKSSTFKTKGTIPSDLAPILISPADGTIGVDYTNVNFIWSKSNNVMDYSVESSTDSLFGPLGTNYYQINWPDTTIYIGSVKKNTIYYWRIRANFEIDTVWSQVSHFTTNNPPTNYQTPKLIYPPQDTIMPYSDYFLFEWGITVDANYYNLEISKNTNFIPIAYADSNAIYSIVVVNYSFDKNVKYYWKVEAVYDSMTLTSNVFEFTISGGNSVPDKDNSTIKIFTNLNQLYIQSTDEEILDLSVYDILGCKIQTKTHSIGTNQVILDIDYGNINSPLLLRIVTTKNVYFKKVLMN